MNGLPCCFEGVILTRSGELCEGGRYVEDGPCRLIARGAWRSIRCRVSRDSSLGGQGSCRAVFIRNGESSLVRESGSPLTASARAEAVKDLAPFSTGLLSRVCGGSQTRRCLNAGLGRLALATNFSWWSSQPRGIQQSRFQPGFPNPLLRSEVAPARRAPDFSPGGPTNPDTHPLVLSRLTSSSAGPARK